MISADPLAGYIIVPYSKEYKDLRQSFDCGVTELNRYLEKTASQDIKKRACALFMALSPQKDRICGYYTLSMSSINLHDIPTELRKKLPRYPGIPAVMLGRLAVDLKSRGIGLGEYLLIDAMRRSIDNEVAWWAMVVESKEGAEGFYKRYGFIPFKDSKNILFLPYETIKKAFG